MFKYDNKDRIVSMVEAILSNQKQLFELYFEEVSKKYRYLSPLREDNNPGCYFWEKDGILFFVDWADNKTHRDIISFTADYHRLNYIEAIRFLYGKISSKNYIGKNKPYKRYKKSNKSKLSNRIKCKQDVNTKHLEYLKQYYISEEDIDKYNINGLPKIKFCNEVEVNSKTILSGIAFLYLYSKNKWKVYFPNSQRRFFSNVDKNTIGYYEGNTDFIVITKSVKDSLVLSLNNISSIHFQSETSFPDTEILDKYIKKYDKIILIFDNDKTGITQVKKLESLLKENYKNKEIKVLLTPFKDIADSVKILGKDFLNQITFKKH